MPLNCELGSKKAALSTVTTKIWSNKDGDFVFLAVCGAKTRHLVVDVGCVHYCHRNIYKKKFEEISKPNELARAWWDALLCEFEKHSLKFRRQVKSLQIKESGACSAISKCVHSAGFVARRANRIKGSIALKSSNCATRKVSFESACVTVRDGA